MLRQLFHFERNVVSQFSLSDLLKKAVFMHGNLSSSSVISFPGLWDLIAVSHTFLTSVQKGVLSIDEAIVSTSVTGDNTPR